MSADMTSASDRRTAQCTDGLERFRAKWISVRVKKTRRNKKREPGSDCIRTEEAQTFSFVICTDSL
jgi:hypothetical protein